MTDSLAIRPEFMLNDALLRKTVKDLPGCGGAGRTSSGKFFEYHAHVGGARRHVGHAGFDAQAIRAT